MTEGAIALIGLSAAILGFVEKLRRDVKEVHVLVNSRMKTALERIEQLELVLEEAGITSPEPPKGQGV